MNVKECYDTIRHNMALAFFASAYADAADESGNTMRGEIMDQLPSDVDPAAYHAADTLIMGMIAAHTFGETCLNDRQKLARLYLKVNDCDHAGADRECTPELFGYYCAMQAMGHGVGLESFGYAARDALTIPYCEFGSHSLQKDYF